MMIITVRKIKKIILKKTMKKIKKIKIRKKKE